jgi:hypothetical protein
LKQTVTIAEVITEGITVNTLTVITAIRSVIGTTGIRTTVIITGTVIDGFATGESLKLSSINGVVAQ